MSATTRLRGLAALLLPLLGSIACKSKTSIDTGIIVEITSDLVVPAEMNQVQLVGSDSQGNELYRQTFDLGAKANRESLPFRVGLYPLHDTARPIHVEALGLSNDTTVVSRGATLSFVRGKRVVLPLPLLAVCKPVKCTTAYTTCKANGKCEPDSVDGTKLPPYLIGRPVPGQDAAARGPDVGTSADAAAADMKPDTTPGKSAGTGCGGTGECQAGLTCLDGVCCTQATCPQCQNCGAGGTCSLTVANTDDTTGTTCTGANVCNVAGVCKKKYGESCTPTGGECAAGTCTDNRCCSQSCGVCQRCTGAGGTCVAVTGDDDPDTCTGGSTCNTTGACKKRDGQTCSAGSECLSGNCNSSYLCGPLAANRCAGLAATCGPLGNLDCCASLLVPGGTFYRSYDGVDHTNNSYPATVSDFYLDKYEITVGRFRQFVNAGKGTRASPPAAGDGTHPLISGSGWDSSWNTSLAADTAALRLNLKCSSSYQTWTDTAGENESKPINCLDWYTAFAFCAWDGGRLPTETEWNYAASGGDEQRYYPWSNPPTSTAIDNSQAVYCGKSCNGTQNVGTKSTMGDGRWGQADLAGNLWEWTLDWYGSYSNPCNDCANLAAASHRAIRGGVFGDVASVLRSAYRNHNLPGFRLGVGARCARTGPALPSDSHLPHRDH